MKRVIIIFFGVILFSCDGAKKTADDAASEVEAAADEAVDTTEEVVVKEVVEDGEAVEGAKEAVEEIYCCTNHDPSHCGTEDQLTDLVTNHECSGFD